MILKNENQELKSGSLTMVIFGSAGDLSQRKLLPTLHHISLKNFFQDFSILGFGLPEMSDNEYRNFVHKAITKYSQTDFQQNDYEKFSKHIYYESGDLKSDNSYEKLAKRIIELTKTPNETKNIIFYLAVPYSVLPIIIEKLKNSNLAHNTFNAKIIIEKPFGTDRNSAIKLNQLLLSGFEERQIYRIDHYLGKDTVQSILFFRFGNSIFEPIWNRTYIDHIQITVAEEIGVEHRADFYEQSGVIRDMVQNHIMQLISLISMEAPSIFESNLVRDEKVKIFNTIKPMDNEYISKFTVLGQYGYGKINDKSVVGYREEQNISPDSKTATFFAAKFYIDNWRWANVPFYVRTGKRLAKSVSEIYIQFKQPPLKLFINKFNISEHNSLMFRIQPQEEICLCVNVKYPGISNETFRVDMPFNHEKTFNVKNYPYERLLIDCINGDSTLFARQDGIEAMWSVVDPIIQYWESNPPTNFPNYTAGTWGTKESHYLLEKEGRKWQYARQYRWL